MSKTYRGQCKPDDGPVLVLVRYGCSLTQTARNSLSKNNPLHGNYCGRVVGMGDDVTVLEDCAGVWPRHAALCVLWFECRCEAQKWYECTTDVKQPDWLGWVEIIMLPLRKDSHWDDKKRYFELLDLKFTDRDKFDSEYVPKVAAHLKDRGANIACVATEDWTPMRGNWTPGYVVINQFESEESFKKAYYSEDYDQIRQIREATADSVVIVSQLDGLWRNK